MPPRRRVPRQREGLVVAASASSIGRRHDEDAVVTHDKHYERDLRAGNNDADDTSSTDTDTEMDSVSPSLLAGIRHGVRANNAIDRWHTRRLALLGLWQTLQHGVRNIWDDIIPPALATSKHAAEFAYGYAKHLIRWALGVLLFIAGTWFFLLCIIHLGQKAARAVCDHTFIGSASAWAGQWRYFPDVCDTAYPSNNTAPSAFWHVTRPMPADSVSVTALPSMLQAVETIIQNSPNGATLLEVRFATALVVDMLFYAERYDENFDAPNILATVKALGVGLVEAAKQTRAFVYWERPVRNDLIRNIGYFAIQSRLNTPDNKSWWTPVHYFVFQTIPFTYKYSAPGRLVNLYYVFTQNLIGDVEQAVTTAKTLHGMYEDILRQLDDLLRLIDKEDKRWHEICVKTTHNWLGWKKTVVGYSIVSYTAEEAQRALFCRSPPKSHAGELHKLREIVKQTMGIISSAVHDYGNLHDIFTVIRKKIAIELNDMDAILPRFSTFTQWYNVSNEIHSMQYMVKMLEEENERQNLEAMRRPKVGAAADTAMAAPVPRTVEVL